MASRELTLLIVLLQMICVIVVIAYLITRTRFFTEVLDRHFTIRNQLILTVIFGLVSIYGTESGIEILGAVVNVRDLGPMVGGLVCGPVVGIGAGIIGAAYRFTLGGFTVIACVLATLLAGVFSSIIYLWNKGKFIGVKGAVVFAAFMESFHLLLVILICEPLSEAIEVVGIIGIPMILANSVGMFVFAYITSNLITERRTKTERDEYHSELERKRAEMEIARDIQASFLPEKIPPARGADIAAMSFPATEVGGDFYDVIPLAGNRIGLVIADVSGKGVPAALFMALSRTIVRAHGTWHMSPRDAIKDANVMISEDSTSGMFVTLFYAIYEIDSRILTYVNAGHNPPMLIRSAGDDITLDLTGIALGVDEDQDYTEKALTLQPGDMLVLYTDGVTEAINAEEEQFGEGRLGSAALRYHNLPANEIIMKINEEMDIFSAGEPQFDDITLMVMKVQEP